MSSFFDYLGPEDHFHRKVYEYLMTVYSKKSMFWHTPNEGKRTPFERWKAKFLGITAGVSDWIIMKNKNILFLELKDKGKKPTEKQKIFIENAIHFGFPAFISDNFEEAKKIIDDFMEEKF